MLPSFQVYSIVTGQFPVLLSAHLILFIYFIPLPSTLSYIFNSFLHISAFICVLGRWLWQTGHPGSFVLWVGQEQSPAGSQKAGGESSGSSRGWLYCSAKSAPGRGPFPLQGLQFSLVFSNSSPGPLRGGIETTCPLLLQAGAFTLFRVHLTLTMPP